VPKIAPPDVRWLLEENDSTRLQQQHPALWSDPEKSCITCFFETKPTADKTFRWWNFERTEVVQWECDCVSQWLLHRKLLHHGIGKAYQRLSWSDAADVPMKSQAKAMNYLENSTRYVERGMNLIFHSPDAGTGKTMMLMLLAKGLLSNGTDVFVAQMNSIVELYSSGWRSAEEKAYFERRVMNCGVLGIDDLGKETGQNRIDFIDRLLDRVIRHRTANAMPVITTTNLTPDQIRAGYNNYVMSLLSETCDYVETAGRDWRPASLARMTEEISMDLSRPVVLR
jgi:DNA replication protein DnaC